MSHNGIKLLTFALVAALLAPAALSAKPGKGMRQACRADAKKLCEGVERGEGRILKCLTENESELSTECKTAITTMKERRQKFRAACGSDADQFCADSKGKPRKMKQCMRKNKDKLSEQCKTFIKETREKRKGKKKEVEEGEEY